VTLPPWVNVTLNVTYPGGLGQQAQNLTFLGRTGDVYQYGLNFTNTTATGTYSVSAGGCDASNNCGTASRTFEARSGFRFHGVSTDQENGGSPLLLAFSLTDSSGAVAFQFQSLANGTYNQTVYSDTYNRVDANLTSDKLRLTTVPITATAYNPMLFGNIPAVRIGAGAVKGLYISTRLTYGAANVTINYSGYSGFAEPHLAIYYCSNYTQAVGCNGTWTRANATDVIQGQKIAVLPTTVLAPAYALAQYICGDGVCESSRGENAAICSVDCGNVGNGTGNASGNGSGGGGGGGGGPPGGGPPSGGGAGTGTPTPGAGGGGQGQGTGAGKANISAPPSQVEANIIFVTIKPGEGVQYSISVTNNLGTTVTATARAEGDAAEFISFDSPSVELQPNSVGSVVVNIISTENSLPGTYQGTIIITVNGVVHRRPITVKIVRAPEPILEVRLKVLSKFLQPGNTLRGEVTIVNIGEVSEVTDSQLTLNVKPIGEDSAILTTSETVAVRDIVTRVVAIPIPDDVPADKYVLEAVVIYSGGRSAKAVDDFELSSPSLVGLVVGGVTSSIFTYIILLLIVATLVGRRVYRNYIAGKRQAARFIFPMDFRKLPQPGPTSVAVGKIAETDVTAYIDINKLQMHSIAAGGTGSGKSVSAQVLTEELLERNIPVICFDPTAQWTGFIRPQTDPQMLALYRNFGMKPEQARSYKTNIVLIKEADLSVGVNIFEHMKPGEITVFVMNKLPNALIDDFVRKSVENIFAARPPESKNLRVLLIFDEVHRLLPKYGGKGGYTSLERGFREFRKWGIGLFLISQVLLDFKGAIRANISNEIQLRTKYEGDIGRVKVKYGSDYASRVTKLTIGSGLFQNPEYNDGKPWFVSFRALKHSTFALTDAELDALDAVQMQISDLEKRIASLKAGGRDTYDLELELKIAGDKTKQGSLRMAQSYIDSLNARLKGLGA